jgi:hypothetical protein
MEISTKKPTNVFEQKTKESKQQGTESFGVTEINQSLPEEKIDGIIIKRGGTAAFNDNIATGKTNTNAYFDTDTSKLKIYNNVTKQWVEIN